MLRSCLALTLLAVLIAPVAAEDTAPPAEVLGPALAELGIGVDDLGYRPPGHWNRYPHPNTTPYVMPFFVDLLARPLDTYEFTRTLGNAVEDHLTLEALTKAPTKKDRAETCFRLGVLLGTERRIGGFRGYSANLNARPHTENPLFHALEILLERSGAPLRRPMSFGGQYDDDDDPKARLRAQVAQVPEALRVPLARFVLNLVEARAWIDLGLRHVPVELRRQVFAVLRDVNKDTPDGLGYDAVLDDVAKLIDEHSLHYGCLMAMQATQDARRALTAAEEEFDQGIEDFGFRLETPWGRVVIDHNPDPHEAEVAEAPFLLVRWGGRAVKEPRRAGATSATRPLSVALLLDWPGDVGTDPDDEDVGGVATGVLGCGLVYATGDHGNVWQGGHWALGAGLFGMGVLIDEGGDDTYRLRSMGQGAAYFGAGLLLDADGNDRYELLEGDGQGWGAPGGIGILADRRGNDRYYAEPDATKAGRGDYHSKDAVAVSNAQGVGSGRRGDGSDGHNWAGGLGALIDVDGDDHYEAGNFSMGLGYWYGTGLLWDGGGNDHYESVYFTQGSGAHFAVGALIDEGGDDVHHLGHNAGAAFGFGWDVVNAMLLDRGHGNDQYICQRISLGVAEVRSNAFFFDEGGDDRYVTLAGQKVLGDVDQRKTYEKPGRTATFPFHLPQVAVFLDLGGSDTYLRAPKGDAAAEPQPDPEAKDDHTWRLKARDEKRLGGFNVAIGRDLPAGRLGFLDAWPARKPPAPSEPASTPK
jgi:hypothetical protein